MRSDSPDYQAPEGDAPILNILRDVTPTRDGWAATGWPYSGTSEHVEIVHTDLNAVIHAPDEVFREFSVFFHDELKALYTRNFDELAMFEQLAGVRDGFAINYGASGMGAMLLAKRKGIGPAADCPIRRPCRPARCRASSADGKRSAAATATARRGIRSSTAISIRISRKAFGRSGGCTTCWRTARAVCPTAMRRTGSSR